MKSFLKSLPAILISIIVVAGITYAAGSLTAPGTVQNTMYSLTDLYNLSTGATTTVGTGSIPSTPESVSANLYSITEVYDAISDEIIQITPEVLALGTTVFGVEGTLTAGSSATPLKTGQTTCYDPSGDTTNTISCPGSGQDGEYQSGVASSYTDNSDGTITDNSTGLMWLKDPSELGGVWGTSGIPIPVTFAEAITNCEALDYAGHTDWRLPSQPELYSLVDMSSESPSINTTYFSNTQLDGYWAGTTYIGSPDVAWVTLFSDGTVSYGGKSFSYYTRCVR